MQDNIEHITLALAGMTQAISLVRDLAQTGKADEAAFQTSIQSIFQIDPQNSMTVYGNTAHIQYGLKKLIEGFSGHAESRVLLRYIISLIYLQKKIMRSAKVRDALKQRVLQIKKQADYFHFTHPTVIANLADTYLTTISSFRFRIMIWGNPRILNTSEAMEKIRALLLAGIRSAVLWKQVGGSRLHLLFSRKKIKMTAEKILSNIKNETDEKELS